MKRILAEDLNKMVGETVTVAGWVNTRRDHGKIIFIDLRDRGGLVQVVFVPNGETYKLANQLRPEWVVEITGKIAARPKGLENDKIVSGKVELQAEKLKILNEAKTLPFEIDDTKKINEELRMQYRYLDLRNKRMQNNLKTRATTINFFRDYLVKNDFVEVETPYITKGTPEGAREFIIPARLQPGKFYVLPQSPQQFKQLLMVAGLERYFQIARCFRDEDPRGDRQAEFTQLDVEMSFIEQEDILEMIEKMMIEMVKKLLPNKKITLTPFPRFSYDEAMKKYGSDKPDLRKDKNDENELAFCWIVNPPLFEYSKTEKKLISTHHPFTRPDEESVKMLENEPEKATAEAYDLVLNGFEVGGGSIRIHERDLQEKIFAILGIEKDEALRRFGHLLQAFEFGAPPHGGVALGLDRFVAILSNEENIREVIAFPKTGDNRDLMMDAPSELPEAQLKEVHIKTR